MAKHLRRFGRACCDPIARARQYNHRNPHHDLLPVFPVVKLRQIIRAHQPDKPRLRAFVLQHGKRLRRVACANLAFKITDMHARMVHNLPRRRHAPRQLGRPAILQRIAWTHQPPDLIQVEALQRLFGYMHMPRVRRIKRSPEQPNPLAARNIWQSVRHDGYRAFGKQIVKEVPLPKQSFGSARTAPTGRALRFQPLGSCASSRKGVDTAEPITHLKGDLEQGFLNDTPLHP